MTKKKLLYLLTEDWFFLSHFQERALAAVQAGYDVVVMARDNGRGQLIKDLGLSFIPLNVDRRSINPFKELKAMLEILKVYQRERPDIVHHVSPKPIFYGTLAALLSSIPAIVNAPVGMGYVFSSSDRKARMLRSFVRLAYRWLANPRQSRIIFENQDDLQSFVQWKAVSSQDAVLIRGSGVDIVKFLPSPEKSGPLIIVLIARMLVDKGIREFVQAAHQLYDEGIKARFVLVGDPDPLNPTSLSVDELQSWHGHQGVEWWGWRQDIINILSQAHVACLPSYREGLPRFLLESAACGLPIVTTDTVGCREIVKQNLNGFLVPIKDSRSLAEALRSLIQDTNIRQSMGIESRKRAEEEFSSEQVITETLKVYSQFFLNQKSS